MTDKIRWGIFSTGRIGRAVIPAIQQSANGEAVAVASRDLARAQAYADELGIPRAYGSYEQLIDDPEIDAIYNPLPNDLHAPWSMRAADAGKAVLCEKPLALDAVEARRLVDYFEAKGKLLVEGFMYRFHPQIERLKALVGSGGVGELRIINTSFSFFMQGDDDIRLVKAMGGGALMDIGCYCVSIMRLLTGEEPDDVRAFGRFNSDGVDLTAAGALSFPSGVLGHFDCSMSTYFTNVCEVRGTRGRIVLEPVFTPAPANATTIRHWHDDRYEEITIPAAPQYRLMVEDFNAALLGQQPPRYPAEDAVRNMQVLDKLRLSAGWTF